MEAEARARRTLHVGGLDENVTEELVRGAFIPFGELREVNVPLNYQTGKNKGFAFVEFDEDSDAQEALDNMNGAEIMGKTLKVTFVRASQLLPTNKAVWDTAPST